jgi:uncharacterized membrane protein YfcA
LNVFTFTTLVALGSLFAGFLSSLTGLGGGVIVVPMLVILFRIDIHYAIGAALVSVIANSSGAAAYFVRHGYTNIRLGMALELATTLGGVTGAWLVTAAILPKEALMVTFGVVLLASAALSFRIKEQGFEEGPSDSWSRHLRLDGVIPTLDGPRPYRVRRFPAGFGIMYGAGVLSGLLGIGSGVFKVLALDNMMKVPFKVGTTTSTFMIGVTAAASAGLYLRQGYIVPDIALPVVLGSLSGALLGARVLPGARTPILRLLFILMLIGVAGQMIYEGLTGG